MAEQSPSGLFYSFPFFSFLCIIYGQKEEKEEEGEERTERAKRSWQKKLRERTEQEVKGWLKVKERGEENPQ